MVAVRLLIHSKLMSVATQRQQTKKNNSHLLNFPLIYIGSNIRSASFILSLSFPTTVKFSFCLPRWNCDPPVAPLFARRFARSPAPTQFPPKDLTVVRHRANTFP